MLRFTILTPSYNRASLLPEALASMRTQDYPNVEHWILDGGSTDETARLLARHEHLRVLSEPDKGYADALNKGLARATGDVIGILNTDDLLPPGTLTVVARAFAMADCDIVTGEARFFEDTPSGRVYYREISNPERLTLTVQNVALHPPVINARFYRRAFVETVGNFDGRWEIAGDREWLLRVALARPREQLLHRPVYDYRRHEQSLTLNPADSNGEKIREEHIQVAEEALDRRQLTAADRAILREWLRLVTVDDFCQSLRRLRLQRAFHSALRGARRDPSWFAECHRAILRSMAGISDNARNA
jgi:glycosyltransferase involved in cell wall biosynthesis